MASKVNKRQAKRSWRKVKAPQPWRPDEEGDELVGRYVATELREGSFGEFKSHVLHCDVGLRYVTGRIADELFAAVLTGTMVKVVFKGYMTVGDDLRSMKLFELYEEVEVK